MASPALKDLPKVAENLKSQLEGFNTDKLKNASTHEKIVLPTAEDVAAEKTQQSLISGIATFDPSNLKPTETNEKNPLPDKEASNKKKKR
nr:thymosin beta [Bactrocera oleae]XP_014099389.2 thymosin beta [Bactrocera oleae]XP_036232581.1 thymosin beta [Bactrocera oleae]